MNKSSSLALAAASAAAVAVLTSCKPAQPAAEASASPTPAPAATAAAATPAASTPAPASAEVSAPAAESASAAPATAAAASSDGIKDPVATVNGEPISKAQLDEAFNEAVKAANVPVAELTPDQKLMGYRQLLDRMIMEKLLTKAADGVVVPQADIDKQIAQFKAQFPDEEAFGKQLTQMGLTPESLNSKISAAMQQEKWVTSQIEGKVNVSDDEAKKFYDENKVEFEHGETVKASHILFMVKPDASPEESKKQLEAAKKAIARAKKEDFTTLAKELSEEPGAAESGGDLGYFEKDRMVPEFADAAFSQKVNAVSTEPVKTQFGYHVIKVTDKKPASTDSFESVKDKLIAYMKNLKESEEVGKVLDGLKNAAKIENTLPEPPPAPSMPMLPGMMPEGAPAETAEPAPATEPPGKGN
jgi:peptidyl-prolyl cis-trans isomerase C